MHTFPAANARPSSPLCAESGRIRCHQPVAKRALWTLPFLWGLLVVACACSVTASETSAPLLSPWQSVAAYTGVPSLGSPALLADEGESGAWLAWPGPPGEPNVRLVPIGDDTGAPSEPDAIRRLALGIRPSSVQLFALADHWSQLLWLEARADGTYALVGGTLGPSRQVERGPTDIGTGAVLDYAAASTPAGELLVLWTEAGGAETALWATVIDGLGRPRAPVQLGASARFPALGFGPQDRLHVAWLESGPGGVWSVRYLDVPSGPLRLLDALSGAASTPTPVGVVRTGSGQMVDGLALGLDSRSVYLVWSLAVVNAQGVHGAVSGLVFAQGAPDETHSLDFTALPALLNVRWPVISHGPPLPDGILLTLSAGPPAQPPDRPLVLRLAREGILVFSPVMDESAVEGTIGPAALAHDTAGNLTLAWAALRADGTATLHVAARPAGRQPAG